MSANTTEITMPMGSAVNSTEYHEEINSLKLDAVVKCHVVTHAIILSIISAIHKPKIMFNFILLIVGGNIFVRVLLTKTEMPLPKGATQTMHSKNEENQEETNPVLNPTLRHAIAKVSIPPAIMIIEIIIPTL